MKISIITVNLNNAEGLRKTIESVVCQNYRNYEFIIIDGGSTDGSVKEIEGFSSQITYWISESDSGIYNAMNKGIKKAIGEYLLFLNSGDYLYDMNVLDKVAIHFNSRIEILMGNKFNCTTNQTLSHPEIVTLYYCLYKKFFAHQSAFIHKDLFTKYGNYNEFYKINSDYEFFLKTLGMKGVSYKRLNFVVTNFDGKGISSIKSNQPIITAEIADIIAKNVPVSILQDYNRMNRYGDFKMKYLDEIVGHKVISRISGGLLYTLYKINSLFK